MFHPTRGGVRGGKDQFKWEDVKGDQFRENFLGHSVMAPVGRWQKGKDLTWYAKGKPGAGGGVGALAAGASMDDEGRKEELQRVKEEEEAAMMEMLGLARPRRKVHTPSGALDKREAEALFKRGAAADAVGEQFAEGERIKGVGFGTRRKGVPLPPASANREQDSGMGSVEKLEGGSREKEAGGTNPVGASAGTSDGPEKVMSVDGRKGERKRGKRSRDDGAAPDGASESSGDSESESGSDSSAESGDNKAPGSGDGETGGVKETRSEKRSRKRREQRNDKRRKRREEELAGAKGVSEKRLRRRRKELRLERKKARREARKLKEKREEGDEREGERSLRKHEDGEAGPMAESKKGERGKSASEGVKSLEDMLKAGNFLADREEVRRERRQEWRDHLRKVEEVDDRVGNGARRGWRESRGEEEERRDDRRSGGDRDRRRGRG